MRKSVFIFVVLLSACTVGPNYEKPQTYSDAQLREFLRLSDKTKYPRSDWYRLFGDETLNALVEKGLQNNNDLKASIERLRQARSALKIYGVQYLPTLDAAGKYDYAKSSKNIGVAVDYNYFQVGLDAAWELDIWGAGRRLTEEYQALFGAAAANLEGTKLSLTAEIVTAYVSLRTAQEQLRVANENLRLQSGIYDVVLQKYNSGLTDDLALSQARYVVETTKSQIPDIKYQIEAYKNALSALIGELPQSDIFELSGKKNLAAAKFDFPLQNLYDFPLESLRNRPDIMAAEYNLMAKNAAVGQAIAKLYPNISISATAGYQSTRGTRLFTGDSSAYGYTPLISLPIFHWGALVNNVELQKNIRQEYLYTYSQTLLNAVTEAKNSMEGIRQEYAKNKHQREAYNRMRTSINLTLEKYKSGLVEFSDLLEMQQKLLAAQNDLVVGNGMIYSKIAAFYKAIGVYPYNKTISADRSDSGLAGGK